MPELTPGAEQLLAAAEQRRAGQPGALGLRVWLLVLVERLGAMAEALAQGLQAAALQEYLRKQIQQGEPGEPLEREALVALALAHARDRGKSQASERDLAAVILARSGYTLVAETPASAPRGADATASPPAAGEASPAAGYRPRAQHPTPTLERFARDLTRAAVEQRLRPLVGRAEELQLVIETLCRLTKRNPVLVGPAGVGKTAIVEGLAQRVVRGEVPAPLAGVRLLALQPSTVVAGASHAGELEQRMQALLGEASHDGIILFIDEIHSVVGAGGMPGSGDVASLLKPALARGDLACIAATTDDEYRRVIEPDAALERRFQPIRVQELSAEQTLPVLQALRDDLARLRGVRATDEALRWLVDFARQYLRNRTFPDKGVDLLEQCVAAAVTRGAAVVEPEDAAAVAHRMVGMPLNPRDQRAALEARLAERPLLTSEDTRLLLDRLDVTLRGFDLHPTRPNAVALLAGPAAAAGADLAAAIAAALFGAEERVVTIDFGRMTESHHVSLLLGAPPGYVGYSEALPLHRVAQTPWCVLLCEHVDQCHPTVLAVLANALASGFFVDARGKRIYLSDSVVLLTAGDLDRSPRALGDVLRPGNHPPPDVRRGLEEELGSELLTWVDLVCTAAPQEDTRGRRWLEKQVLAELSARYRERGVEVEWEESVIEWLLAQQQKAHHQGDLERVLDGVLSPPLVKYLPERVPKQVTRLRVRWDGGAVQVDATESTEGSNG